jgi:hydroxyacylglutathione hydrolase
MNSVLHVCAFEDNYIWLLRSRSSANARHVIIVDPGDAEPVLAVLAREQLIPAAILCTHHHYDHVDGVPELLRHYPVPVYGPARESIAAITQPIDEGTDIHIKNMDISLRVLATPGHTRGHVAYYGNNRLFCGDTLFSAGCGRLFEGTAAEMHTSLMRLAALPTDTAVYCTHEYTQANLRFALTVEPGNPDIQAYRDHVVARRQAQEPTLPSTIGLERRINPFLRADEPAVRAAAEAYTQQRLETALDVFTALRRWKDHFK